MTHPNMVQGLGLGTKQQRLTDPAIGLGRIGGGEEVAAVRREVRLREV